MNSEEREYQLQQERRESHDANEAEWERQRDKIKAHYKELREAGYVRPTYFVEEEEKTRSDSVPMYQRDHGGDMWMKSLIKREEDNLEYLNDKGLK